VPLPGNTWPPAIKTVPSPWSVADCDSLAADMNPVALKLSVTGSNTYALLLEPLSLVPAGE